MITVNDKVIGKNNKAFVIAEVAQAHDGSLGMAHAYVDAAAEAGVDAVKFQTHIASAESTLDEPFRVKFSLQDDTRYDYWARMEFSPEQWEKLKLYTESKGLVFISSPFSIQAVDLLNQLDIDLWKVGSGETVSADLMNALIATKKPVIVSTGMSSFAELEPMAADFDEADIPYALLQCTSKYPVPLEDVGLNVIEQLKQRFHCPVGLSDHSGTIFPPLLAIAKGANLIEAHVVFDKRMYGPDTSASLTIADFKMIVEARDAFFRMENNPLDKDAMSASLSELRDTFGKSLSVSHDLPRDTILTEEVLVAKKPATGIPLSKKDEIIGKRLRRKVSSKRLLTYDDFD